MNGIANQKEPQKTASISDDLPEDVFPTLPGFHFALPHVTFVPPRYIGFHTEQVGHTLRECDLT